MSDSFLPISDEQAKLGQEVVKTFRDVAAFIDKALGSTPEDLVGYFGGDRLRVRRAEHIARMLHEAQNRLAARGVAETQPATLSVALPIVQAAADEDREEIVDLWARLLANAMDPALRTVRYSFIQAVKKMDPPDAVIAKYIREKKITAILMGNAAASVPSASIGQIGPGVGLRSSGVELFLVNLVSLGFLSKHQNDNWYVTSGFVEFMLACYPEIAN